VANGREVWTAKVQMFVLWVASKIDDERAMVTPWGRSLAKRSRRNLASPNRPPSVAVHSSTAYAANDAAGASQGRRRSDPTFFKIFPAAQSDAKRQKIQRKRKQKLIDNRHLFTKTE